MVDFSLKERERERKQRVSSRLFRAYVPDRMREWEGASLSLVSFLRGIYGPLSEGKIENELVSEFSLEFRLHGSAPKDFQYDIQKLITH